MQHKSIFHAALLAGLLLQAACRSSPEDYIKAGDAFLEQGKTGDAVLSYQKAVSRDSRYGPAYYRLAKAETAANNAVGAYDAYVRAVELLPENREVHVDFANFLLAAYLNDPGREKRFYELLQKLAGQLEKLDNGGAETLRIRGLLALDDRRPAEAIRYLEKAAQERVGDPRLQLALAQAYLQNQDPQRAEQIARAVLASDPKFAPTYDFLAGTLLAAGRRVDLEELYRARLSNLPEDVEARLQLAAYYTSTGKKQAAQEVLAWFEGKAESHPQAVLRLGDYYLVRGEEDKAIEQYRQGIRSQPAESLAYRTRVADLLWRRNRGQEALEIWNEAVKAMPGNPEVQAGHARMLAMTGKVDQSVQELEETALKNPNDPRVLFLFAQALITKGDLQAAQKQFQAALAKDPGSLAARFALAEIALASRDFEGAVRYADPLTSRPPWAARARLIRASALTGLERFGEARTELRAALRETPDSREANLQLGLLELAERKYAEAEKIFTRFHRKGHPDLRPVEGLAEVYFRQGQPAKALALWKEETEAAPQSAAARSGWAAAALRAGDLNLAIAQSELLLKQDAGSAGLHMSLGELYRLAGQEAKAKEMFLKAKALDPSSTLPLTMAAYASGRSAPSEAEALYRQAIAANPNDHAAKNNLAWVLAEQNRRLDEALSLARAAQQAAPANPEYTDTLGYVYLKRGESQKAVETYRPLVARYQRHAGFHYHYGLALSSSGDKQQAKKVLETALDLARGRPLEGEISAALKLVQ